MVVLVLWGCAQHHRVPGTGISPAKEHGSVSPITARQLSQKGQHGFRSIVLQPTSSEVLTFRVAFRLGSANDPPGKEGLAALTARLMAEGGAGSRSYRELQETLYPMAALIGVQVDREQTVFHARVHRDYLAMFGAVLRDVLVSPRFHAQDFRRVSAQIRDELEYGLKSNNDEAFAKEVLQSMLYQDHPFGHPTLGTLKGLTEITLSDVNAHYRRHFCLGRTVVGVSGNVSGDALKPWLKTLMPLGRLSCSQDGQHPTPGVMKERRAWLIQKPSASATAISIGMRLDVRRGDADYPALVLAATYLGQHRQFIGRLMQKIREQRGLNYGDYAYAEHFRQYKDTHFATPNIGRSRQFFSIWLRPVAPTNAAFVMKLAVRELEQLVTKGLSATEFKRIQSYALRYFPLANQSADQRLGVVMDAEFYGATTAAWPALLKQWRRLTVSEFNAAVQRRLKLDGLQFAVITADGPALKAALINAAPSTVNYTTKMPSHILNEDKLIARYDLGLTSDRVHVIAADEVF
jgi:zinc protease